MMRELSGGKYVVKDNSIAQVAAGPIPGNTPTTVPKIHPIAQKSRFVGSRAN
jgi:hypothetical protein